MLKKENRLKSRRAFSATYYNNSCVSCKEIVLYKGKDKDDKNCPTRVGFVVSKKVHKRAVIRNKIKRKMREVIRLLFKENLIDPLPQSLIFRAKDDISDMNLEEIKTIILNLLNKTANKNI